MDSSPDLSLKLRRGSSDSRESFYMDFAQGIDSDIEDVVTMTSGGAGGIPSPCSLPPASLPEVVTVQPTSTNQTNVILEEEDHLIEEEEEEEEEKKMLPKETVGMEEPPARPEAVNNLPDESGVYELPPISSFPSPLHTPASLLVPLPALDIDIERDSVGLPPQPIMPSPSVPQNAIVSPETFSTHTSPAPSLHQLPIGRPLSPPHPPPCHEPLPPPPPPPPLHPPPAVLTTGADYPSLSSVQELGTTDGDGSRNGSSLGMQSKTPTQLGSSSTSSSTAFRTLHTPTSSGKAIGAVPPASGPMLVPLPLSGSGTVSGAADSVHSTHRPAHRLSQQSLATPASGPASQTTTTTHQHLSVLYHSHHHHLHPILTTNRRPSRLPEPVYYPPPREVKPGEALATTLSALYGKLLVVMGIAFPMAEVISTYIPPSFYEGFYLYLYIGSMVFLLFMYTTLLWGKPKMPPVSPVKKQTIASTKKVMHRTSTTCSTDSGEQSDSEDETISSSPKIPVQARRMSLSAGAASRLQHFGSFYLRMGAVAFGIGSMIYSGLEFGQYFELERNTKCHNVLLALTPATRMAFIFIQMYFIFLNNEQIKVYRHKIVARFGLMHMIGTNLSVWFSVLIQETKHEILTFYNPENRTLRISHRLGNKMMPHPVETVAHLRVARGLKGPHNIFECRRSNIIGTLVQDASPFLFPCTIEYSLICAAILYVMWRSISRPQNEQPQRQESLHPMKRSPHHYSVDCAGAHKGLFIGILILVLTIISLILFFVLISRPEFVSLAVTEVNICELTLYGTTTAATLIGMFQVRHMQYDAFRSFSLDDILLVGGQTGSFLYSTFTVIGGHFTMRRDTVLVLITALASLVETACQTMFILDASRRSAATQEHIRKKPGREIVTFLLVSNLAMWAINTLEKSRAESHPIQLHFYGLWAWTIITHVSMPLAIFYRFHSTVCLCEIWKRAYKMKPAYM
ncbi:proton channel OtopLc isoform X1 [Anopheles stephensi]|uniref:proton channel OtopLc isoform X1 n=1 Tax=Anopheles stephensi TaxID=30069 RepID=UPI001658B2FB|nr:proton channel OtopLc isoform X1 [Anopheles stephensi]XP_035902081.1 proton channel OtopLc isoform X1 [Anopheles stephensi]XP_035902089.1 proton channel OtopLc isoform X1 [Anopheles stephensi]XP_035902101.1 proton channel OtopLc isoform X1 [Anopheles stephensi]